MSTHRTLTRRAAASAVALAACLAGSATGLTATPSAASASSPGRATAQAAPAATSGNGSGYLPDPRDKAQNARLQKALDAAVRRAAVDKSAGKSTNRASAVTVYYDDSQAPSFNSLIDRGAAIWNARVSNVKLVQGTSRNASLTYYEGNDSRGSYYYGDGHGRGYILLDYAQSQRYSPQRIVTHETGHALGLPDRYTQPCSKLMSGGGPGPSCTNPYPDSVEASQVNTLWRNGLTASPFFAKAG